MFKKLVLSAFIGISSLLLSAQTPQIPTSPTTPVTDLNAKYVQGVGIGYAPTVVSGLNIKIGPGTSFCAGSRVAYSGATIALTPSTINYIYISSACSVTVATSGYPGSFIPIARVVTGSSTITSIGDDRTLFTLNNTASLFPLYGSGAPSSGLCSVTNTNQLYYNNASTPYLPYVCNSTWHPIGLQTAADINALGAITNNTSGTASNITAFPLNQSVSTSGTPSFASLTLTSSPLGVPSGGTGAGTLTGYVKGNGTSAFTASATIPYSDITGAPTNVSSVFTRSGAVVAVSGDYTCSQITASLCTVQAAGTPLTSEPALNFTAQFDLSNAPGVNTVDLHNQGVAGTYTCPTTYNLNNYGLVTAITNGTCNSGTDQYISFAGPSISGSGGINNIASGNTTETFSPAQPDTSYNVSCSVFNGNKATDFVTIFSILTNNSFQYNVQQVQNNGGDSTTYTVNCHIHHP